MHAQYCGEEWPRERKHRATAGEGIQSQLGEVPQENATQQHNTTPTTTHTYTKDRINLPTSPHCTHKKNWFLKFLELWGSTNTQLIGWDMVSSGQEGVSNLEWAMQRLSQQSGAWEISSWIWGQELICQTFIRWWIVYVLVIEEN